MTMVTSFPRRALAGAAIIALGAAIAGAFLIVSTVRAAVEPATNPELPQSCGIDMVLVLDTSTSINNTELDQMRSAFNSFVDAMLPGTPARIAVVSFDDDAVLQHAFDTDADAIKAAINATDGSGFTNWEAGLSLARSQFTANGRAHLIVFSSDGNPTASSAGPTDLNQPNVHLDPAITQANLAKGDSIRIITLGIGDDLNVNNLKAISGPTEGSDYFTAVDFDEDLANALADIATALCGGTITVTKIIDRDGNVETTGDQSLADGWNFTVAGSPHTTGEEGGDTGKTAPEIVSGSPGPFDVVEVGNPAWYSFISAECKNQDGDPHGTPGDSQVTGITLDDQDIISCLFYNEPASATLNVIKVVQNNLGGEASSGDFDLQVSMATTSQANPFDTETFSGEDDPGTLVTLPGDTYYVVTEIDGPSGYAPQYGADCFGSIGVNEEKTCTVTNSQIPEGKGAITIVKSVVNDDGGSAPLDGSSFAPFMVGDTEVTLGTPIFVDPGTYDITENSDSGYLASFSPSCENGSVMVGEGESVTCVIVNDDIEEETPPPPQCSDGKDNDSDGETDYPNDPGCDNPSDNDETNSSGGPTDACPNLDGFQPEGTNCLTGGTGGSGGGGGGGGSPFFSQGGRGGGSPFFQQGQVLGATCGLYMDRHLRRGSTKNNLAQTNKLQQFLIKHGFLKIASPTGFFGPLTEGAVKAFQQKYAHEILAPWNLASPTGLVYLSTLRWINMIECPELALKLPPLIPWSQNPNAQ